MPAPDSGNAKTQSDRTLLHSLVHGRTPHLSYEQLRTATHSVNTRLNKNLTSVIDDVISGAASRILPNAKTITGIKREELRRHAHKVLMESAWRETARVKRASGRITPYRTRTS